MSGPADLLSHDDLLAQRHFIAALARRMVGEGEADDVAQEAYVRLLGEPRARPRVLRGWLRVFVRNVARQVGRGQQRRLAREATSARSSGTSAPAAAELAEHLELQRRLIERVLALPGNYREVVLLHFHAGRTVPQIAADLDVPQETVRTRLRRALGELRAGWNGALGGEREGLAALLSLTRLLPESVVAGGAVAGGAVVVMSNSGKLAVAAAMLVFASGAAWWAVTRERAPQDPVIAAGRPDPADSAGVEESKVVAAERVDEAVEPKASEPDSPLAARRYGAVLVRVHLAKQKTPIPRVPVLLHPEADPPPYLEEIRELTDEQGEFLAERVLAGSVIANAAGFKTYVGNEDHQELFERECTRRITVKPGETTEVELVVRPELDLAGIVLDPQGAPVANASIWVSSQSMRWPTPSGQVFATSDREGRFHLPWLEGHGYISAFASGFAPSPSHSFSGVRSGKVARLELQLVEPGARVYGRVEDEGASPIEGAIVYVAGPYGRGRTLPDGRHLEPASPRLLRTDPEGRFDLDGTATGSVELIVRAIDHAPFRRRLDLQPRAELECDVVLRSGGSITGIVTGEDGTPVAGLQVCVAPQESVVAWNHREILTQSTRTADDGRFRIDHLPSGPLDASVDAKELGTGKLSFSVDDGATREWSPVLSTGLTIRGRVVDERGVACVEWRIKAHAQEYERGAEPPPEVTTDAEGRFALVRCRDAKYQLNVYEPGEEQQEKHFATLVLRDVVPAREELRIEVPSASRANAYFVGRFRNDEGQPIPDAVLYLCQQNGGSSMVGQGAGDAEGFRLGPVPPGDYQLRAHATGYPSRDLGSRRVEPGESLDLGVIAMAKPGLVEIRVRRADGAPLRDRDVEIWSEQQDVSTELTRVGDLFRSSPLAPGTYFVVGGEGNASCWTPFEVTKGRTTTLSVEIESGALRSFRLLPDSGRSLPDRVEVTLATVDGDEVWTHAWSRRDEVSFQIAQLFARGCHLLKFVGSDGSAAEITFDVETLVAERTPIDVVLR